ncbi:hypothetical protein VTK73DRAFT_2102 [Phialemonium thermophilum]|uniref:Amidohydrolase-related domain-containing protein n=1 Tax=Phialemonium thermophilum TaxID=223376 RepID=A0ABR3VSJ1_9PEZI
MSSSTLNHSTDPGAGRPLVVDIHSHVYPQSYLSLLRDRTQPPYIQSNRLINRASASGAGGGKPLTPEFSSVASKLEFMDAHRIDVSILSLGNPWLDFCSPEDAGPAAAQVNDEFQELCSSTEGARRLFFFAVLPLSGGVDVVSAEVRRLTAGAHPHLRGVVMGSRGFGAGLDDLALTPVWEALAAATLPVFLHPNYGLPAEVWGPRADEYGQVLPVAMAFPLETTITLTRMVLGGVFQRVPNLKCIASHAGGALPFLAGRVEHAVNHDRVWASKAARGEMRQTVWQALRENIFLDGILYHAAPLRMAAEVAGPERVLFGTDHPFFQPLAGDNTHVPSAWSNQRAAQEVWGKGNNSYDRVMGSNAVRLLDLGQTVGCQGCS